MIDVKASSVGPPARVLVTGAEGFVGGWLMRALRNRLPKDSSLIGAGRSAGAGSLVLDITQRDQVIEAVRRSQPTCVVHLAAIANVGEARRDARTTWNVNLGGTLNLVEAITTEAPAARLVFVGTSEAYGATFNAIDGPLREDAPLNPTSVYGASKAAADILVGQMAHDGLDAVRFRPFNHAGPGQTEAYVVSAFAAQVARIEAGLQEPVLRVGDLEPSRDFLDVRDVVEAYVRAVLLRPGSDAAGAAINLASGQPRRIRDVLSAILARSTVSISVEPDPQRMRASDTPFAVGDASRARAILDWTPSISFDAMIGSVLDHWRRVVAGQEAAEGFSAASASP